MWAGLWEMAQKSGTLPSGSAFDSSGTVAGQRMEDETPSEVTLQGEGDLGFLSRIIQALGKP